MDAKHLTAADVRIHALINPRSGIGCAGLVQGNYDDNNIRNEMDGVSFAMYRGFNSRSEAFNYFSYY